MISDPLRPMLRRRAELLRATRAFFDQRDILEVQPPCLSADNVVDAHIDPVEVAGSALLLPQDQVADRYFLQTSPEFAMKRMLALGAGSIYSLGPVFRAGERSPRHNIEFTMLEWYLIDANMADVIQQTIELVQTLLCIEAPRVVTYRELFRECLGIDPLDAPIRLLEQMVAQVDSLLAQSLTGQRDELLDVLMTERIEPQVAKEVLLIKNYPATQAALAKRSDEDPLTSERFELLIHGLELANGYGELLDGDELLARNYASNRKRIATGRTPLPVESRLLAAMRKGMPACAGVALGFDRLVMLACQSNCIDDVLSFPIESA